MYLDFDNALNGLWDTIPNFDFSNFASKETKIIFKSIKKIL
jgi:hypothetical protein